MLRSRLMTLYYIKVNEVDKKKHIKAFLTNFEIACEAGILALIADILWLTHDIVDNGMSIWYGFIFIGLVSGLWLTIFALVRHHKYYTHRLSRKRRSLSSNVIN